MITIYIAISHWQQANHKPPIPNDSLAVDCGGHLVRLPVPEKVDGSVHPPLDHSPATWVVPLVAPHLHKSVGVLGLHQVHTTGRVALFQSLQTVLKWT